MRIDGGSDAKDRFARSRTDALRAAIIDAFPELAEARFVFLTVGWDSVAVDVDDRLIFKFPRHEAARKALLKEVALLPVVRNAVTMSVPDIRAHAGPPLFTSHTKIPGDHLERAQYEGLPETARRRLAADLALFHAEMHALDRERMAVAGATAIEPWFPPREILKKALPALPGDLHSYAERTVAAWNHLPPDPHGTVYGFFDGHGWNMAFDFEAGRLNGIYDFADSGFGALHQDFIYSSMISPDLTERVVTEYEVLTGRLLDRRRIALLTGVHRLWELADQIDDPALRPDLVANVLDWARHENEHG